MILLDRILFWSDTNYLFLGEEHDHYPPYNYYNYGIWGGAAKYVGIKLVTSEDTLYGWFYIRAGLGIGILSYGLEYPESSVSTPVETELDYVIYPNPSKDLITISCLQNSTLEMYGAQGQLILNKELVVGLNEIDVNNFAVGIYFLKLNNTYKSEVIKFVKY